MQEPMTPMSNDQPQGPSQDPQEGSPLDSIISSVDQFIADPKSITPDALGQLKMDLEDLKTVMDGDQSPDQAAPSAPPAGGLAGMIGGK